MGFTEGVSEGGSCRWSERLRIIMVLIAFVQVQSQGGSWKLLSENVGIASMHTAVTHYGSVIMLDRTNIGPSNITLPHGRCRNNPKDLVLPRDCYAHSVEFFPKSGRVRPLYIWSDTWCSSGQFGADGTLVHTGGDYDGIRRIRRFVPCPESNGTCDWKEDKKPQLYAERWYASNQLLPDGTFIVVGGRSEFTVEFVPPRPGNATYLPLLEQVDDYQGDNMYPFVHLLPDGNLFIFANRDSIVYDYRKNVTRRRFPRIPGTPRCYPSAGSSVLLPLRASDGFRQVEILVCGGAQLGAWAYPEELLDAAQDCGRLLVSDPDADWVMETMPIRRAMGDMVLLPNQHVTIINGASRGSQGWGFAEDPVLYPVDYDPRSPPGSRFAVMSPTVVPRMYHSTANLLPDGGVLVAGSNTHHFYTFNETYNTELRVEQFRPEYMSSELDFLRPAIVDFPKAVGYGESFSVAVVLPSAPHHDIELVLLSSPFTTHSFSQGQRMISLAVEPPLLVDASSGLYHVTCTSPPTGEIAPAAYYMLFALNYEVPGEAVWVQIVP
ncbi:hypothetical protein MPTK1_4g17900 [Marchantia polymorpha subsp. ruderalis]|uniref:Galactose oxidase-like Early set domain-containing protein n=2 Tax=Marchantia polymorpha TaxID=3197 RepID=A0AAF6BB04_MARPO|nr:hypothetical protein MARPO_0041s0071 [Marchantia polymorpha]BBN09188.1 hypothetical protein Mp_4g17900 [Marchantia polymorpha subsp. ruderalis]|eukprot:PTQ40176.1 hypothetical protein MARPO_0041s0071 [Marchantia polymorpha]